MDLTAEQLEDIIAEAKVAAKTAAINFLNKYMNGEDQYPCGFAWVDITKYKGKKIKGNMKIGRMLKAAGIKQNYQRRFQIWNPSGVIVQNVDMKEAGAQAATSVFLKYGFTAHAGSRLD